MTMAGEAKLKMQEKVALTKATQIEETESLKLALFATQLDAAGSKQALLTQQFENLKIQIAQVTKDRDAFSTMLVEKYGLDVSEDQIDLDTRNINRGMLKKSAAAPTPATS